MKKIIRRLLRAHGYDIAIYSVKTNLNARKTHLLKHHGIDLVLDVGANVGQFSHKFRHSIGYSGVICSFEPLSAAYAKLEQNARGDVDWRTCNIGLGDEDAEMDINVSANLESSSLLPMLPTHVEVAPHSAYVGTETISVRRLDSVFTDVRGSARNIFLKLDVQGFEERVLAGARSSLSDIKLIQVEMSLTPLYEGEPLLADMLLKMADLNYDLIGLEPGYVDLETGALQQVDGLFLRNGAAT